MTKFYTIAHVLQYNFTVLKQDSFSSHQNTKFLQIFVLNFKLPFPKSQTVPKYQTISKTQAQLKFSKFFSGNLVFSKELQTVGMLYLNRPAKGRPILFCKKPRICASQHLNRDQSFYICIFLQILAFLLRKVSIRKSLQCMVQHYGDFFAYFQKF